MFVPLKKKIAQMFIVAIPLLPENEMVPLIKDYISRGIGGFMVGVGGKLEHVETNGKTDVTKLKLFTSKLKKLDPGLFLAIDGEGGTIFNLFEHITALKSGREYGKIFEKTGSVDEYTQHLEEYTTLMRECGINMDFTPILDIAQQGYKGYMTDHGRAYSDNAETVMRLSSMAIESMHEKGIIAVGKHFPNYGLVDDNPHNVLESQKVLGRYDEVLLPFAHAIRVPQIKAIMKGHCVSPLDTSAPASLSIPVEEHLRDELGFDGLTIIDEIFMKSVREHYGGVGTDKNGRLRIVDAAKVNDILLVSYPRQKSDGTIKGKPTKHNRFPRLLNAVHKAVLDGRIPKSTIEAAYRRICKSKKELGLL